MISICIPVGPYAHYKQYLPECLESVRDQTLEPADVVIIDDMAGLTEKDLHALMNGGDILRGHATPDDPLTIYRKIPPREMKRRSDFQAGDGPGNIGPYKRIAQVWRSPWLMGIPGCANAGIALGGTELVFQLSCDDKIMPTLVEECWKSWQHYKDPMGYYWVGIEYSHGETQALPTGHAMVPKALWRHTGGFAPELAIGACDPAFVSMMLYQKQKAGTLYPVANGTPLYWHREHDKQYTKHQIVGPGTIIEVRDWFTKSWEPVDGKWGRYNP